MADKYHSDTQEKIEASSYGPGYPDSGDLEAGTKTITATSEASGLANADYSKALTLVKPDDARLVVKRIASRLAVTIDSFDAATHLYCRVYVDQQDANHRLFDEDWTTIGAKLDAVDTYSGALSTIFDLLKDGSAHTFYFFFWVNQANNAVISVVQLWKGVGTSAISNQSVLEITHEGLIAVYAGFSRMGTGNVGGELVHEALGRLVAVITNWRLEFAGTLTLCKTKLVVGLAGTVSTDLNYLY